MTINITRQIGRIRFNFSRSISTSSLTCSSHPHIPLYIAGQPVTSSTGGTVQSHHAKTGEKSCEVVVAGEEEIDRAVKSSTETFGSWKDRSPEDRRAVLLKVADLLEDRFDAYKSALLADVSMSDILIGADRKSSMGLVRGAAETALSIETYNPRTIDGAEVTTTREPFGPVLSIPAFNFPMTLALRSIVDPLACGNTVIFKTSRYIPQLHAMLHPLFADAGLPSGALQVIHCSEEDVGARVEQMIAHRDVRMVNFTGSTRLGRILAAQCGKYLKPSIMELGGKSPAIVLESADVKLAANNILFGALFNSGQVCMSTERVLVHESKMQEMEAEMRAQWKEVADKPFDVVRGESVSEVRGLVQEAVDQGATTYPSSVSTGPQMVLNPSPSSAIWSTETFSPTLTITSYTSLPDLLDKLNSVPTGLSTAIFGDTESALSLAKRIESGSVHINGMTIHDETSLPFGGVRDSGWGRFNGRGAIEGFTWLKNTRVIRNPHLLPVAGL